MLKLRTLTAESRHGTTIRNHIHIGPSLTEWAPTANHSSLTSAAKAKAASSATMATINGM
jgi:hypothetical protein